VSFSFQRRHTISHLDSLRDFDRARRKAFIQQILSLITGQSQDLLSFEEVQKRLRLRNRNYRGLQQVPLDRIVGSVGRYRDFTRTFLPRGGGLRERWAAVEDRVKEGGLPPVELFLVGDVYFVRDGNHRVSIARTQGAPTIEAYVWEYPSRVPLGPDVDPDDLFIKQGYVEFLEQTHLDKLRPAQNIEPIAPGGYRELLEHIAVHRYFMDRERGGEMSYEEAVVSWYDNVYCPVVEAIRAHSVLQRFPGRTEADLYIWVSRYQYELSRRYGRSVSAEVAVDAWAERRPPLEQL